jgi:Heterokaryon incompatibility protein (HET)
MRLYDGLPLKPEEHTTRVMRILPAKERSAPIIVELFVASLDTNPQYAALSYCWGSSYPRRPVTCNGTVLEVGENLALALSSIRSMSNLPLWVDQVCINQADVLERSSQVACMDKIYSQATETFVYLGEPDSPATETACKVLTTLFTPAVNIVLQREDHKDEIPLLRAYMTMIKLAMQNPHLVKRSYNKDVTETISQLAKRPYFSRKWVIQEIAVSRALFCVLGLYRFEWDAFILTALKESPNPWSKGMSDNTIQTLWLFTMVKELLTHQSTPLLTLLYFSSSFKAADPRDYVFALLGVATDSEHFPKPDYGVTVEQLYRQISSCLVQQGKGFLMLRLAGIRSSDNGMPSWVVDWRGFDTFYHFKYFASFRSGEKAGNVQLGADAETVCVVGKVVDHVGAIGQCFKAEKSLWDRLPQYIDDCTYAFAEFYGNSMTKPEIQKDLASLLSFDMKYDANYKYRKWFVFEEDDCDIDGHRDPTALDDRTSMQLGFIYGRFVFNKFDHWLSRTGEGLGLHGLSKLCQKLRPVQSSKFLAENEIIRGIARTSVEENVLRWNFFRPTTRPIMTQQRRLGLAPALTEEGDVVCVVSGANAPFVLRPCEDGTYKIVGEAYVRDIMFGETLNDNSYPWEEIVIS